MWVSDINECSSSPSPCHVDARCNNTIGSYRCACNLGYTGNGKTCTDINECSSSPSACHVNAQCNNTIGSYRCACNLGFTGNGKTCTVPQPVILFPLNAEYETRDIKNRTAPGNSSGVNLAPGPYGEEYGSYEFFGNANSFIEFPNSPGGALDVRYSMTILCWVYYDEKGGPDGPIFNYNTGGSYGVHIWVLHRKFYAVFNNRIFSFSYKPLHDTFLAGGWKFVGASYDNETGEIKLWVDGALKETNNMGAGVELGTQRSVRMGVRKDDHRYFKGKISQLQIYNEALSQQQILKLATKPKDINECSSLPSACHVNAQCNNTIGSYRCVCKLGYTGRGKTCTDINECNSSPSACHVNAQCNNTIGSYRCVCNPGYNGNGKSCTDLNECTALPSACHVNAQCNNTIGSYRCTCNPGYTGSGKTCTAVRASSCNEIFQNQTRTKSQVYTLMLGSRNISVYCFMGDFGCGSGGWTLVMKTDGTKSTFNYSSPFWSDRLVYNLPGGMTGFDGQETKLPSYWETQFSKLCLGMRNGSTTRFVVIQQSANSLYALIADGTYRAVSLGRNKWKSLIGPQASLQVNCNKEGFNVVCEGIAESQYSRARIGIIANEQNDCSSCDSRIGYGTGGLQDDSNTCGNVAKHSADNGDKYIKAMGYILVQ
ncbi:protein crumbs-like [Acropora millepora]|uniref:protein crumbs-like n=1 Tax=Acropora millepora TaxID=45264 RepID=UPI001CF3F1C2|nr:protein crumbs-like [Acropora millepora]